MKPTPDKPGFISAEKLCQLSGLTDRQHRNIAKAGYYPPPIKGQYQMTLTITGLLRYYREAESRIRGTKEAISQEKLAAMKRENEEAQGLLVLKSAVAAELQKSLTPIKELLRAQLEGELPRAMSGMALAENRIVGKRVFDHVCDRLAEIFGRFKV